MYQNKKELRQRILGLLKNQSAENRALKSRDIEEKLFGLPEFESAKTILFYASLKEEVNTYQMIRKSLHLGKSICLPRLATEKGHMGPALVSDLDSNLGKSRYGIDQPGPDAQEVSLDDVDLVIVPGIVFDRQGNRLGRGGGYYDRMLSRLSSRANTFGLAFDFQIVDDLPFLESHDTAVSRVISN